MAENTTVARPYAEAAFEVARERNALASWSRMLSTVAALVRDPRVAQSLDNPRLGDAEKESLLLSLMGDALDEDGRSFVRVHAERGVDAIGALSEVEHATRLVDRRRNRDHTRHTRLACTREHFVGVVP